MPSSAPLAGVALEQAGMLAELDRSAELARVDLDPHLADLPGVLAAAVLVVVALEIDEAKGLISSSGPTGPHRDRRQD
jgi:hypothetical protein